jgi:hypothetical protein
LTKNVYDERYVEVEKCVQKSLWLVPNASSVTTILPRIRRLILTEWRPRSIADSARLIPFTRKLNNSALLGGNYGRCFRKAGEA